VLYLNPEKVVPAQQTFFVVGSKAKGTMTMKSRIVFNKKKAAKDLAGKEGEGEVLVTRNEY
jgi:nitrous oxide reductase accessory protein NosL